MIGFEIIAILAVVSLVIVETTNNTTTKDGCNFEHF
jgi:hypothetical protein